MKNTPSLVTTTMMMMIKNMKKKTKKMQQQCQMTEKITQTHTRYWKIQTEIRTTNRIWFWSCEVYNASSFMQWTNRSFWFYELRNKSSFFRYFGRLNLWCGTHLHVQQCQNRCISTDAPTVHSKSQMRFVSSFIFHAIIINDTTELNNFWSMKLSSIPYSPFAFFLSFRPRKRKDASTRIRLLFSLLFFSSLCILTSTVPHAIVLCVNALPLTFSVITISYGEMRARHDLCLTHKVFKCSRCYRIFSATLIKLPR